MLVQPCSHRQVAPVAELEVIKHALKTASKGISDLNMILINNYLLIVDDNYYFVIVLNSNNYNCNCQLVMWKK